jgi:hypothetical protein
MTVCCLAGDLAAFLWVIFIVYEELLNRERGLSLREITGLSFDHLGPSQGGSGKQHFKNSVHCFF